ncbi:hypothetical protein B0E53_05403 [Micromonospora sp. MH33]|nr:hypothetical protein B0E53_05403 [Micromonospora sp. MH33]
MLTLGGVGALVLGLSGSVAPWLAPPVLPTARALAGPLAAPTGLLLTVWALAWAAVVLAGYAWGRRSRA